MQVSQVFLPPVKSAIGHHFFELQSFFPSLSSAFIFARPASSLLVRLRLRFAAMHSLHVLKLTSNSSVAFDHLLVEQCCVAAVSASLSVCKFTSIVCFEKCSRLIVMARCRSLACICASSSGGALSIIALPWSIPSVYGDGQCLDSVQLDLLVEADLGLLGASACLSFDVT